MEWLGLEVVRVSVRGWCYGYCLVLQVRRKYRRSLTNWMRSVFSCCHIVVEVSIFVNSFDMFTTNSVICLRARTLLPRSVQIPQDMDHVEAEIGWIEWLQGPDKAESSKIDG